VRNQSDRLEGETEKFVRIIVSDTGIGIAKKDQEKIFNRFFRVDKARSREQGGSGLGLSICKWIVEAHQGEIRVESELGKGSTFIVKLPLSSPRMMN
jgi:two-component system phosphate regulon sensor histidine kinase PhoR